MTNYSIKRARQHALRISETLFEKNTPGCDEAALMIFPSQSWPVLSEQRAPIGIATAQKSANGAS